MKNINKNEKPNIDYKLSGRGNIVELTPYECYNDIHSDYYKQTVVDECSKRISSLKKIFHIVAIVFVSIFFLFGQFPDIIRLIGNFDTTELIVILKSLPFLVLVYIFPYFVFCGVSFHYYKIRKGEYKIQREKVLAINKHITVEIDRENHSRRERVNTKLITIDEIGNLHYRLYEENFMYDIELLDNIVVVISNFEYEKDTNNSINIKELNKNTINFSDFKQKNRFFSPITIFIVFKDIYSINH